MTLTRTDTGEPTLLPLADAMKAWQRALDTTLSASGLSYPRWTLLRGIASGDYVRHQPYVGTMLIDVDMAERLLAELHRDRWIAFVDRAGRACGPSGANGVPIVAEHQRHRIERIALSMKALHSVSVSPLNAEERALLCTLLQRMQQTLDEHSDRQSRPEPDPIQVSEAPLIRHAMLGASAWRQNGGAAASVRMPAVLPWRG